MKRAGNKNKTKKTQRLKEKTIIQRWSRDDVTKPMRPLVPRMRLGFALTSAAKSDRNP